MPFIATLAMLVAARGLAPADLRQADPDRRADTSINGHRRRRELLGVPLLVIHLRRWSWLLGWVLLNRTTFGRRTFAIGGNPEAARLAGINVRRHTMLLYALSGLCCGIAAIMLMARTTTGLKHPRQPVRARRHRRRRSSAAPCSRGGRGTIIGSLLGVLVFTTITNLFILNNLATEVQNIAKGVIIVAAVLLQQFRLSPSLSSPAERGRPRAA